MKKPTKYSLAVAKKMCPKGAAQQKRIALALRRFQMESDKELKTEIKQLKAELKDLREKLYMLWMNRRED